MFVLNLYISKCLYFCFVGIVFLYFHHAEKNLALLSPKDSLKFIIVHHSLLSSYFFRIPLFIVNLKRSTPTTIKLN